MGKLVLLHLDALSLQYLRQGWLPISSKRFIDAGCAELQTGLSYEGITASMMTGVQPARHQVWTHFALRSSGPARSIAAMGRIPSLLARSSECRSYGTIHGLIPRISATFLRRVVGIDIPWWRFHYIPLQWLRCFDFALPKYDAVTSYDELNGHVTIAGLARQAGLRCHEIFGSWTRVVEELPRAAEEADFVFAHTLMELDQAGHQWGPSSEEVKAVLRDIDRSLADLLDKLGRVVGQRGTVIAFSDHGMCPITLAVDVGPLLRKALAQSPTTVMFVDSTLIRIWCRREHRNDWLNTLSNFDGLRLLTDREKDGLPEDRNIIGDLAAVAEPGTQLLPNFWQGDRPIRGMHGYASHNEWLTAFLSVLPTGRSSLANTVLSAEDVFSLARVALFQ